MSLPQVVNGTVGFGNDALPVKPFNTPLAKTTRLASANAPPFTAHVWRLEDCMAKEESAEVWPAGVARSSHSFIVAQSVLRRSGKKPAPTSPRGQLVC